MSNALYMFIKVIGFGNCQIKEKEITGIIEPSIKRAIINSDSEGCTVTFHLNTNTLNCEEVMKSWSIQKKLSEIGENIIRDIAKVLLENEFCISELYIKSISFSANCKGKSMASSSITLTEIDTGEYTKEFIDANLSMESLNKCGLPDNILSNLGIKDKIVRFETLYDALKNKCSEGHCKAKQSYVTDVIKCNYAIMYNISCQNHNIDQNFWGTPNEYQDDLTFLRTLISHGSALHEDEIQRRIDKALNNIVRILVDLYKV